MNPSDVCPVCSGDYADECLIAYDRMASRSESFRYHRCVSCGLLSQRSLPEPQEISKLSLSGD